MLIFDCNYTFRDCNKYLTATNRFAEFISMRKNANLDLNALMHYETAEDQGNAIIKHFEDNECNLETCWSFNTDTTGSAKNSIVYIIDKLNLISIMILCGAHIHNRVIVMGPRKQVTGFCRMERIRI